MNIPTAVQNRPPADIMESVIIKGDLSKLEPLERVKYYNAVCKSVGLNPLTQPFAYMHLNGKLILYAKKDATDQLRSLHDVSVEEMTELIRDGVIIITCKVKNGKGRADMAKGVVSVAGLRGDVLANAMMKAETKAKRRATLSIVGLGFLDETEVETIPGATEVEFTPVADEIAADDMSETVDPKTGEIAPKQLRDPSEILKDIDDGLAIAAKSGWVALTEAWRALEPDEQDALRSALNGRHKATARQADAERARAAPPRQGIGNEETV